MAKRKAPTRRRGMKPRFTPGPPEIEMKPIRTCDCGHPRRLGLVHTAVGCYPEEK